MSIKAFSLVASMGVGFIIGAFYETRRKPSYCSQKSRSGSVNTHVLSFGSASDDTLPRIFCYTFVNHLISIEATSNGKSDGLQIRCHANGRVNSISFYKDGLPNGPEFYFYDNGVLKYDVLYNTDGKVIGLKEYNRFGNQVYIQTIPNNIGGYCFARNCNENLNLK